MTVLYYRNSIECHVSHHGQSYESNPIFVWVLYVCNFACVCMCGWRYTHGMVHMWRSDNNVLCQFSHCTSFEELSPCFSLLCAPDKPGPSRSKALPVSVFHAAIGALDCKCALKCMPYMWVAGIWSQTFTFHSTSDFTYWAIFSSWTPYFWAVINKL